MAGGRKRHPDLPCVLASDTGGTAITALHLLHENLGKIGKKMAVPANILVDKNGIVRWAHYAQIVMDRPDPKTVLQAVQALG